MVQGLLDFFTGGGEYADPNNIDPRYGVPMGDVRQAAWNSIGNMSALLLAAGQPMAPQQRAAYLAQLGQAGGSMNTDLYNAAQRRLMTARAQQERQEMDENKRIDEMLKDPAQLQSLGIDPQQARVLGRGGVRQLMANRLSQSPEAAEAKRIELEQLRSGAQLRNQLIQAIDADPKLNDQQRILFKNNLDLYAKRFGPVAYEPLSKEQRDLYNIPPNVPAYMTPDGPKILSTGGTTTNVNISGDTSSDAKMREELDKKFGQNLAKFVDAASVSAGTLQDFQVIDELLTMAPQGPVTGRLAQMFPGVSSAGTLLNSMVTRIAPSLRTEGSGATSDIEYEGFVRSLPALINKPDANKAIAEVFKQKAEINIKRGEIVTQYQNGEIDAKTMRNQLNAINRQSILSPQLKQMLGEIGGTRPIAGGSVSQNADGSYTYQPGGR